MNHLALSNDERKELFERLSGAIDQSGLTLNEYVFATADLLKSTFWMSQSTGKSDEELEPLRDRIAKGIEGVVDTLDGSTESVAEDMIVLATVMLEAVNHIFVQMQGAQEVAATTEPEAE